MSKVFIVLSLIFLGLALRGMVFAPKIEATNCKHENAECSINESGHNCCTGLVCVPFNEQSGNYKCELPNVHSPTPSLTPDPTSTPADPTGTPSASLTPTDQIRVTETPVPTATVFHPSATPFHPSATPGGQPQGTNQIPVNDQPVNRNEVGWK